MPTLAANLSTMFCEQPLLERFESARSVGFRAVEMQFPYDVAASELARAARSSNLEIVLINAPAGDLRNAERGLVLGDRSRFEESVSTVLDYALQLDCKRVHVLIGKQASGLQGDSLRMAASRLQWAAKKLAAHGMQLLLEALNPFDQPAYALPTIESADALRREIDMANVRLLFDAYHIARSGRDPVQVLPGFVAAVGHVQISSIPNRNEPDEIATQLLLRVLDDHGYRGFVGCEYNPRSETMAGLGWAAPYGISQQHDHRSTEPVRSSSGL